jgi:hypothetical protein
MSTMDVLRKHAQERVSFGACRGKTLLPVQLKQTNYPTNCLADDTDPGLTGTQTISSGTSGVPCTAYITGSAAMPALQASIANASLSGMNVKWWMTSTTDRPAARGTQDNVTIPVPQIGYRTLPINQPWEFARSITSSKTPTETPSHLPSSSSF